VNNPIDVKENGEHALDFALPSSRPFSASLSLDFPCKARALFPERLSNHCQGLRSTFPSFAQNLMHTRCRIHCQIASCQIHDSE
jgi:hypothetical protein